MAKSTPVLDLRNIGKRFPGVVALDGITFDVRAGAFHAICGENGAGKSTLMKILSGVLTEYEGEFLIRGNRAEFKSTRDAEHAGIAIIHQELNLVEQMTVAANLFLGREKRRGLFLDEKAMCDEAAALLKLLECPIHPLERVANLRVGDQQLVEIAKALSLNADILIMDEPTSALTENEVERLFRVIERLQKRGVTILYISHKMDEVFQNSDRITVLRDGKHVKTLKSDETSPRDITHLMVGREIENIRLAEDRTPGETILEVRNLSLPRPGHSNRWQLKNISFQLRRGEILGIAGLMGAGRTELMECLFGANEEPIQGEILLNQIVMQFSHPADAKAAGIAMVTEDRKRLGLFAQMNVRENISICTLSQSLSGKMISKTKERTSVQESIDRLGVKTSSSEAAITGLSGGNQQKCIIARWLKTNPQVLLLDDPTRGIDVGAKAELYQMIDQLCREGMSLIVTSSELPELITLSDRILVLCEGRQTGELSRAEFSEQRIMELATTPIKTGAASA